MSQSLALFSHFSFFSHILHIFNVVTHGCLRALLSPLHLQNEANVNNLVLKGLKKWFTKQKQLIFSFTIVNWGDWLWSLRNIKGANKDGKIYAGRSTTVHSLSFCAHTLCMNYVTNTFLLVSSSVRSKQLLCFVRGGGQKRDQKTTSKNFVEFHNHSLLLTVVSLNNYSPQCGYVISGGYLPSREAVR